MSKSIRPRPVLPGTSTTTRRIARVTPTRYYTGPGVQSFCSDLGHSPYPPLPFFISQRTYKVLDPPEGTSDVPPCLSWEQTVTRGLWVVSWTVRHEPFMYRPRMAMDSPTRVYFTQLPLFVPSVLSLVPLSSFSNPSTNPSVVPGFVHFEPETWVYTRV